MSDPKSGRAPATPLIVVDPFMSVWSITDNLTDSWPTHWTGQNQSMCGMARIDGVAYRFMGLVTRSGRDIPAMKQTRREVAALETTYAFEAGGIELTLRFTTPTLPDDLELLGRPVTYVNVSLRSLDGKPHRVEAYLDWSTNWAIGTAEREVLWGRHRAGEVEAMFVGAAEQTPLHRSGDEVQIDWGYLLLSAEPGSATVSAFGDALTLREGFADTGAIPARDDVRANRPLGMPATGHRGPNLRADGIHQDRQNYNVSAWAMPTAQVDDRPVEWRMLVAYDQVFSIDYFHRHLRPYWRRDGQSAIGLVEAAWADRDDVCARARAFGDDLQQKLQRAGGDTYARIGLLAFRRRLPDTRWLKISTASCSISPRRTARTGAWAPWTSPTRRRPFTSTSRRHCSRRSCVRSANTRRAAGGRSRMRRTMSASSRWPTARSMAAANSRSATRCPTRRAATC